MRQRLGCRRRPKRWDGEVSQASDLDEMYGAVISPASISSLESNLNSVGQTH